MASPSNACPANALVMSPSFQMRCRRPAPKGDDRSTRAGAPHRDAGSLPSADLMFVAHAAMCVFQHSQCTTETCLALERITPLCKELVK